MKKLIIIQTIVPDYRAVFFETIKNALKNRFQLFAGDYYFETSIKSDSKINRIHVKNIYFLKRRILFQTGIWHLLFKNDVIVLEMNPRIISNWIFLLVRKLFNKETVLWGHAWPRGGKEKKSDFLRHIMRKLGSMIVVYTKKQKEELQDKMPSKKIFVAPNSVVSKKNMDSSSNKPCNIIYVGRLVKQKKVAFMVNSFVEGIHKLPKKVNLIIVGEGDQKQKISSIIKSRDLEDRIILKGHINDFHTLKKLYSDSFFSVSPGYVGLSITQSFGFGVPMLISENENHSPEIEAAMIHKNCLFFKTDDSEDFIEKIQIILKNYEKWLSKRNEIAEFCKLNYSTEAMAETFINLVK